MSKVVSLVNEYIRMVSYYPETLFSNNTYKVGCRNVCYTLKVTRGNILITERFLKDFNNKL